MSKPKSKPPHTSMLVITVHLPPAFVEALDVLVEAGLYNTRAEAIRMAVRDLIMKDQKVLAAMGRRPWHSDSPD